MRRYEERLRIETKVTSTEELTRPIHSRRISLDFFLGENYFDVIQRMCGWLMRGTQWDYSRFAGKGYRYRRRSRVHVECVKLAQLTTYDSTGPVQLSRARNNGLAFSFLCAACRVDRRSLDRRRRTGDSPWPTWSRRELPKRWIQWFCSLYGLMHKFLASYLIQNLFLSNQQST